MVTPPAVLRDLLTRARHRGDRFDNAWEAALAAALALVMTAHDRDAWAEALDATRDTWRAAYTGDAPTPAERALTAVAYDPEREPCPRGVCGYCGKALPADAHHLARYCNTVCQRAMHGRKAPAPIAA